MKAAEWAMSTPTVSEALADPRRVGVRLLALVSVASTWCAIGIYWTAAGVVSRCPPGPIQPEACAAVGPAAEAIGYLAAVAVLSLLAASALFAMCGGEGE